MAAGLLDETVDHAETEARSLSGLFGGEEGFENPGFHVRGHSDPGIRDRDDRVLAGNDLGRRIDVGLVQRGVRRLDGELSALRHGVPRVDGEIEDRALQLVLVGLDRPQARRKHALELDLLAERPVQELRHVPDENVEVERLRLERLSPREGEQAAGQPRRALGALERHGDAAIDSRFVAPAPPDDVETADDEGEEIVEVVRDAPGELADRLHLLGLAKRVLDLRSFGDLARHPLFQLGVQLAQPFLGPRHRVAGVHLPRNILEVADDAKVSFRQDNARYEPLVVFGDADVATLPCALGDVVGYAGVERAPELRDDLVGVVVREQSAHHLGEFASDDVAETLEQPGRDRVDCPEPQTGIDQIDAERRLVEQGLELLRASFERGSSPRAGSAPA